MHTVSEAFIIYSLFVRTLDFTGLSAQVAYTNMETQLKLRSIPCQYTAPVLTTISQTELNHLRPSLVESLPGVRAHSSDLLAGVPVVEVTMSNICLVPLS